MRRSSFAADAPLATSSGERGMVEVAMKMMKTVLRGYIDGDVLLCEAHDWTQVNNYDYIEFRIRENVLDQPQKATDVSYRQITIGDALCVGSDDTEEKVVGRILGILRNEWAALIRSKTSLPKGVVFPTKVKFLDNLQRND